MFPSSSSSSASSGRASHERQKSNTTTTTSSNDSSTHSSASQQQPFSLIPKAYGAMFGDEEEESGRIVVPEHFQGDSSSFSYFFPTSIRVMVLMFLLLVSSLVLLASMPLHGSEVTKGTTFEATSIEAASSESITDILAAIRAERANSTTAVSAAASSTTTTVISLDPMIITAVGDYGDVKKSILPYPFLDSAVFVEPYKATTLTVTNAAADTCEYTWSIQSTASSSSSSVQLSYIGASVTATVSGTGMYTLTVSEMCDGGTTTGRVLTQELWSKYVRRELLSLTDQDREEFLDALQMTYLVNTKDGVEKYGPLYRSMYYFTSIHIDAAGNPVCDQFHKGAGFFSNHIYLGNFLEQSLQAINPRVALHYMEYSTYFTSEAWKSHLTNQLDGGAWTELLSDKWFGRNDPYTGEIVDGRFSLDKIQIPYMTRSFFVDHMIDESKTFFPVEEAQWLGWSVAHLRSPYGLLRPPWSFNPSRGISRYHNEVGLQTVEDNTLSDFFMGADCADYEYFINVDVIGRTFDNYLQKVKEDSHGKIHFNIGGQGGSNARAVDQELMDKHGFTQDDIIVVTEASQKFGKIYISTRDFYEEYEATLKSEVYPVYPMNCSADPWDVASETLRTSEAPRDWRVPADTPQAAGPACQCADYYFSSPETLQMLIQMYFWKYVKATYAQNITPAKVLAMPYAQQTEVMKLLCSRMAIDGDMVGSASPLDPVFWVSHGAIEKLYQRIIFSNLLADTSYTTPNTCSGHDPAGYKAWLGGYYLGDKTVDPTTLTNAQLTELLNPILEGYQRLVLYVYDSTLIGCSAVDGVLVA